MAAGPGNGVSCGASETAAPGECTRRRIALAGRRLHLADGSRVSKPRSTGIDWRGHGTLDLGRGGFSYLELTDKHGTQALDRGTPYSSEIRIGDRNYARVPVLRGFPAQSG